MKVLSLDELKAGVDGCGVEKRDPGMELTSTMSSDMRLLLLGCEFVPRIEGGFGVGPGATDAGCRCEQGFGDAVRFGRHRDGVGRRHHVFLL